MSNFPFLTNESVRIAALPRYNVLNESTDPILDGLVTLIAQGCQAPIAIISFIDSDQQWIKAHLKFPRRVLARADSICAHTLAQTGPLIIDNLAADPRFSDNPLVVAEPHLHSYWGVSILTAEGLPIGTVAVMASAPLHLTSNQLELLHIVARQVMEHLELHQTVAGLTTLATEREQMAADLRQAEERYQRLLTTAQRQTQEHVLLDRVRTALARELDLSTLFRSGVEDVAETFGYTLVSLYLVQSDKYVLQHQVGYQQVIQEITLQAGLIGRVMSTGQPLLIRDVRTDPDFLGAIEGIVSEVCVPLFDRGLVVGVLNVESINNVTLTEADLELLVILADHIGIAIGRARVYAAVQRQAQELALLDKVRSALARHLEMPVLFQTVVEAIVAAFGYTQVSFYKLAQDKFVLQYQVGYENPFAEISMGQGIIGYVGQMGKPLLATDVTQEPKFRATYSGVTSEIAVPVVDDGQVMGVLNIESVRGIRLTEADLNLMLALSDQIGVAMGRARLYGEVNRRNQLLTGLHETALDLLNRLELGDLLSAIVSRAGQLVNTQHGHIYLVEPETDELEVKVAIGKNAKYIGWRLKAGEGLAGKVWQSGQPIVVADYSAWAGRSTQYPMDETFAAAAVPLQSGSEIIGVLGVTDVVSGRIFEQEEVEILTRFAQLAAIAIDNARLYTTAQHELVGRNRTEQALAAANVELEQALLNARELAVASQSANRAKSEFLANMSHELRTPLSAVMGFSELMQGTTLDAEQKDYLNQIRISSEALLGIISDVLDFSKIEAGHLNLDRAEFNLFEVSRQVLYTMMPNAAAKKLQLTIDTIVDVPRFVVGDAARLRQVLLNLLSNAVKFTQQGQIVLRIATRRVQADKVILHFSVQDTGLGIAADKQRMIFEPFTQIDGSMTRRHGGTGLGLAIARQLVEMFDGEIWVESEIGQGSTFHFTAIFERSARSTANLSPTRLRSLSVGVPEPSSHHLNILLAEDNVVNQRVLARMLEKLGWAVTVVSDGRAAVTESGERDYDLILMDIQMPDLDGLSATIDIRSRERQIGGHVPIVALTAYAMQGDRERCLIAGMDDYLSKPIRVEDLQRVIERHVHSDLSD